MQAFVHTASLKVRGKTHLALAAAFLFFVLYSAPHRVHHLFEELGVSPKSSDDAPNPNAPHDHPTQNSAHDNAGHEHDHSSGGSAKADCVAQAVAQNFHLAPAQAIEVSYPKLSRKLNRLIRSRGIIISVLLLSPNARLLRPKLQLSRSYSRQSSPGLSLTGLDTLMLYYFV